MLLSRSSDLDANTAGDVLGDQTASLGEREHGFKIGDDLAAHGDRAARLTQLGIEIIDEGSGEIRQLQAADEFLT